MKSWQRWSSSSVRDPGLDEGLDHVEHAGGQAPGGPHFVLLLGCFDRSRIMGFEAAKALFPAGTFMV